MLYELEQVVEWSVPEHFGSCTFNLYKSENESGPWERVNQNVITDNYYRIVKEVKDSKFNSEFFVLEVTLEDSTKALSYPISVKNTNSKWVGLRAKEVQRREWWLLTKYVGVPSLLFRKKTFGKRCPECWNPISKKVTKDNCPTCIGTSFEGGYFKGHPTYLQYDPTPNNAVLGYAGRQEPNTIPAWTVGFPEATVFDLVLRIPDWKVYRIDSMQTTELQTVPVRQMFMLTELGKNDIEYKLAEQVIPEEYL